VPKKNHYIDCAIKLIAFVTNVFILCYITGKNNVFKAYLSRI